MAQNKTAAREAAKREKEKSTVIYNKLADIAREAFALLTIEPGSYTAAKVAEAVAKYRAHWRENATAWHREDTADGIKSERLTAERWADTIVRDYMQHRDQLRRVCADRLDFYGRNHWAKDDRDRRTLAILGRHFNPATR